MKATALLSKHFHAIGLVGGIVGILNAIWYFYKILTWGIEFNWHFKNLSGWGFRFLFHLDITLFALLLIVPFWLFVKSDAAALAFPSRKLINSLAGIGLLLFLLAIVVETLLQKFLP